MKQEELREKLQDEIEKVEAAVLLPHHRRGALIVVSQELDLLDVAVAIASDEKVTIQQHLESGLLRKSTLGDMADWCVDSSLRLRFVIVQPYVLAQPSLRLQ